jgi:hypothetical protein
MAETYVQLPDDTANTGKLEDHWQLGNGYLREGVVIGDPTTASAVAPVSATNGLAVDLKTLPPGAATAANQSTEITSLASIDTKIPASPSTTGKQDTGNTSLAAIDTNAGATTDSAVTGDNSGTISAKLRGLSKMLADMWDSGNHWLKVSIQNATLAVTQSGTWNITNVSGTVSLPTLAATSTKQSDGSQKTQVVDAGGNVIGATSNALDINIKSGNPTTLPVTNAGTFAVQNKETAASSATLANVSSSATNVTLIASNAARRGGILFNDSTSICYVKFGATATSSSFTYEMSAGGTLELPTPIYTGIIDGIWASANGAMRVTEIA